MEKFQWSLKNGEIEDVKRFVEEDGVDVNMVGLYWEVIVSLHGSL